MSSFIDPVAATLEALAEEQKTPPADRFDELVRSGLIDEDGNVLHSHESACLEPDADPR